MLGFVLGVFRLVWLFGKGHPALLRENLALRQQLSIYRRNQKRPRLIGRDRWFWITLSAVWKDWRRFLLIVHPDTVVRWQRERFPPPLGATFQEDRTHRQTPGPLSDSHFDPNLGASQSLVASAPDSWRTAKARHRGFRTNRVAPPADREAATFADLEELPAKSQGRDHRD